LELAEQYEGVIHIDSPVVPHEPKGNINTHSLGNEFWLTGCLAGIDKLAIRSDGSVAICPQLNTVHGNVRFSTVEEIWINLHSQRLAMLGKGCAICSFEGYCGAGCPAPDSYEYEVAPCYSRRQLVTVNDMPEESAVAAPRTFPCDCPMWCNSPCSFPCDCPTWCASPCSCPTWCALPCRCPTWCASPCACPTHCASPCSCPTWCASPCACPTYCASPCPLPCACPAHCPFPR
jgi:hypothetical protein